jgi:hypothetical protein
MRACRVTALHCSYTDKIPAWKATKAHRKHTNEVRKENVNQNRIMKWFTPRHLCCEREGLTVAVQDSIAN